MVTYGEREKLLRVLIGSSFTLMRPLGRASLRTCSSALAKHVLSPTHSISMARLDNMNAQSLNSIRMGSAKQNDGANKRCKLLMQVTLQMALDSPTAGKLLEGRVAQLAEQLTLNQ